MNWLRSIFTKSRTAQAILPPAGDKRIAVNLDGVRAGTKIINLEVILWHTADTRQFTTSDDTNHEIFDYQMEGIVCRLADITNDVILRFTITALRRLELESEIGGRIRTRLGALKDSTVKISDDEISQIEDLLSYNLSKLRTIAKELGFPLSKGPEALILLRNCLVHRDGVYDEDMLLSLASIYPNPASLCVENRIKISTEFIDAAITKTRSFIHESESILHESFGVPWTLMDMRKSTRFRRINEWAYKERK
ncbi:MAG: hypothetical protein IPL39_16320 [Opitutaceae bacterium]|nr:hypothetical protein [Opitutaceae bacterium]